MSSTSSFSLETEESESPATLPESRSAQKHPRPSEIFYDSFVCPICFEYLTPPVIRCKRDHNCCLACIEKMILLSGGNKCPTCRDFIDKDNRNRFVEEQLEQLIVSCQWKKNGCKNKIPLSRREKHEKLCEFRPGTVKCCFDIDGIENKCTWEGKISDVPNHLNSCHEIDVIDRENSVRFV